MKGHDHASTLSPRPEDRYAFEVSRNVISIRLSARDLERIRVHISPGVELIRAVRRLNSPDALPLQTDLLTRVRDRADPHALRMLQTVLPPRVYTPDFLNGPAESENPSDVAAAIRSASVDAVRLDLERCLAVGQLDAGPIMSLLRDPAGARERLAEAWEAVWESAFASIWPGIRQVLESDRAHRLHVSGSEGIGALLNGLHPDVQWDGTALRRFGSRSTADISGDGRGLILRPSVFGWPRVQVTVDDPWPPTLVYPARNATSDWSLNATSSIEALHSLLGETRALVLLQLAVPATTGEVAAAQGVAASTAHHHLSILEAARLIGRQRDGRSVWWVRLPLGSQLVSGQ